MRTSFILILLLVFLMVESFVFATFYESNLSNSGITEMIFSPRLSPSGMIFQDSNVFELGFNSKRLWIQYSDFLRFSLPVTTRIFDDIAKRYGVDNTLLKAMIRVESSFFIHAVSKSNAKGLMQLKFATARENGALNSFSIFQNVEAGCRYLSRLYREFNSWDKAIAAYYIGPTAVRKNGITDDARKYVKKVKKYWNYYKGVNRDENLRDLLWWSVGIELNTKGFERLNLSLAIPVLGFCGLGGSIDISRDLTFVLNPVLHLTDQLSIGMDYDFKNPPIYSVKLQPSASDYFMFISSNLSNTLSVGLMVKKKRYSILFGANQSGVSAGFTLNFDPVGLGIGFRNGFNAVVIFKPRALW